MAYVERGTIDRSDGYITAVRHFSQCGSDELVAARAPRHVIVDHVAIY